jgi:hypothetical protein
MTLEMSTLLVVIGFPKARGRALPEGFGQS